MNKKIILFLVVTFLLASYSFADKRSEEFVDKKIAEIEADPEYDGLKVVVTDSVIVRDYREYVIERYENCRGMEYNDYEHAPYTPDYIRQVYHESVDFDTVRSYGLGRGSYQPVVDTLDLQWNYMVGFDSLQINSSERNEIIKRLEGDIIFTDTDSSRIFYYMDTPLTWEKVDSSLYGDMSFLSERLSEEEVSKIYHRYVNQVAMIDYFVNKNYLTFDFDRIGFYLDIDYRQPKEVVDAKVDSIYSYLMNKYNLLPRFKKETDNNKYHFGGKNHASNLELDNKITTPWTEGEEVIEIETKRYQYNFVIRTFAPYKNSKLIRLLAREKMIIWPHLIYEDWCSPFKRSLSTPIENY